MGEQNLTRSQAILRMPVDMVDAHMMLHDGDRSDVLLFVPPTEDISQMLEQGSAFFSVMREAAMCFVARQAISYLRVAIRYAPKLEEDFPAEEQKVKVTLRNGAVVEGSMKWIASDGHGRTGDHLNSECQLLVINAGDQAYLIVKSHIAMVREA